MCASTVSKSVAFRAIAADVVGKKQSVTAITQDFLKKIEVQKHLNIFIEVFDDVLAQARQVDKKIAEGKQGKLAGMVLAVKDNICIKGKTVSAGSKMLENFTSVYTATAVERLLAEDAIIIGRTNCDEFAMGSSNETSYYGPVKNPISPEYVPGGSSGGSSAAVAAGMCHVALGSETGGSIRQPASFCGVTGLKPSYGKVSRYGLIAFGSSFDQIGPIATCVEDCQLVYDVMHGKDEKDATSTTHKTGKLKYSGLKNVRIAVLQPCIETTELNSDIKKYFTQAVQALEPQVKKIEKVGFDLFDYLVPTYYVLSTAEASSNLARYDGIHFGYRSPNAKDLESTYIMSRSEGFGKEVKRRILLGTFVLSSGYYDAYYAKAQKVRRRIQDSVNEIFSAFDFIISPTTPDFPFKFGEKSKNPIKMYMEDVFTVLSNLSGIPAISLPIYGNAGKNEFPWGLQIMAPQNFDADLLAIAKDIQQKFGN